MVASCIWWVQTWEGISSGAWLQSLNFDHSHMQLNRRHSPRPSMWLYLSEKWIGLELIVGGWATHMLYHVLPTGY